MIGLFLLTPLSELSRYILMFIVFFSYPIRPGKRKYIYISICLFLYCLLSLIQSDNTFLVLGLMIIFVFISILIIFKERFLRLLLSFFIAAFSTVAWDNLIFTIFRSDVYLSDTFAVLLSTCINSLSLVPFLLIILFILKKRGHYKYTRRNRTPLKVYVLVLIGFFMSAVTISLFRYTFFNDNYIEFPYFVVSSVTTTYLIICITVFFLYKSREKYKLTNALRDQYTKKQIEYYKALLNQDEDIRKFRHDIKNHMICIQELLNTNNIDNVREYINGLYDTIEKNTAVYDTGNDILNAIINYYSNLCKDKDILLKVNGRLMGECNISAMHLCTIASNIISNAYEATLKADDELAKVIQVKIQCGTKYFELTVNNPTEINRAKITKEIQTSKGDKKNHGFGIQNIEDIVSLYDGKFQLLDYGDNVTAKVVVRIN